MQPESAVPVSLRLPVRQPDCFARETEFRVAMVFIGFLYLAACARCADLQVVPQKITLSGAGERVQLVVMDGDRDVTRECSISAADQIVSVEQGRVVPLRDGTSHVVVRLQNRAVTVPLYVDGMSAGGPLSFRNDVMPVLAKAGCNQGACHASQYGKGDLKLSLLGYAPEQDHPPLTRDRAQRRISTLRPEASLLLQKATLQTGHGGGKRFDVGSWEYRCLHSWIAEGAVGVVKEERQLTGITITPKSRVYTQGTEQQLRVTATYNDGSERDITHAARFDTLGESVATVDRNGLVSVVGRGQAAIMIRYEGQATVSHVVSPFSMNVDLASFKPVNFVDHAVKSHWQRLGIQPSQICSDEEFIRRAFLDCIGTLPTPERINTFVNSKSPQKRIDLVDELLGLTGDPQRDIYTNEWSAWWTLKWGDLLRINRNKLGDGGMWSFSNWVRNSLRENKPVDQFVREIVTAQGSVYQNGPSNYFKTATKATDLAETTAQIFLGVRLQCARCHHHPFEVYSQADYYGLAAFFTRVGTKASTDFGALGADTVVRINASGSIRHPRTGTVMEPTPLRETPAAIDGVRDIRQPLADWLTSPENRLFARNIANRIWGYYMGAGLVEPIDDMRATNPPSNPELLDALAQNLVDSGFDLKQLMRSIMISHVYQLSATPRPEHTAAERLYVHYNVKRISAEALLDAIDFACGTSERFTGVPPGTRAIELPDTNYASYFLDTLGRPKRVITCECERTTQPNLAQVLHIANGDVINRKLADKNGRLSRLEKLDEATAIRELFQVSVSRLPNLQEVANSKQVIAQAKTPRQGLEDLLWALLNSREFLFNH